MRRARKCRHYRTIHKKKTCPDGLRVDLKKKLANKLHVKTRTTPPGAVRAAYCFQNKRSPAQIDIKDGTGIASAVAQIQQRLHLIGRAHNNTRAVHIATMNGRNRHPSLHPSTVPFKNAS